VPEGMFCYHHFGISRRDVDRRAREVRATAQLRRGVLHETAQLAAGGASVERLGPGVVVEVQARIRARRQELERLVVLPADQPVGQELLRGGRAYAAAQSYVSAGIPRRGLTKRGNTHRQVQTTPSPRPAGGAAMTHRSTRCHEPSAGIAHVDARSADVFEPDDANGGMGLANSRPEAGRCDGRGRRRWECPLRSMCCELRVPGNRPRPHGCAGSHAGWDRGLSSSQTTRFRPSCLAR
jgi:hypothetical protein